MPAASINITRIPLLPLSPCSCSPTIRPRSCHKTCPLGEPGTSVVLQTSSSGREPPCRCHDLYAQITPTTRIHAKPVIHRVRIQRRRDGSKVERVTDRSVRSCFSLSTFFFFFATFLLSVSFQSLFLLSTSQLHTALRHDRCLYVLEAVYTYAHVPQYHTPYLIVLIFFPCVRPTGMMRSLDGRRTWGEENRDEWQDMEIKAKGGKSM